MFISQIIEALPPLVYIRRGELVIQFDSPSDLLWRVAKLSSVLAQLDQESGRGAEGKNRAARPGGRLAGNGSARGTVEADSAADSGTASDPQPPG